jgi:hypothetical protein
LLTGILRRDTLILESGERSIVHSHDTGVQQLLWRARELTDELRLWLALLEAGRSLSACWRACLDWSCWPRRTW